MFSTALPYSHICGLDTVLDYVTSTAGLEVRIPCQLNQHVELMSGSSVDVTRSLQNEGGKGKGDPAPTHAFVDLLDTIVLSYPPAIYN